MFPSLLSQSHFGKHSREREYQRLRVVRLQKIFLIKLNKILRLMFAHKIKQNKQKTTNDNMNNIN